MILSYLNLKQEKQAFQTHYNYANCLASLTDKVTLLSKEKLSHLDLPELDCKLNLINLTKKSLQDEYRIVKIDKDYSYASTSWLPIKGYYLIYNMLLTIEYILTGQKQKFNMGHQTCVEEFTSKLFHKKIQFDNSILNKIFSGTILNLRETSGANLSTRVNLDRRYQMAMRKVSIYKCDDLKRKLKINLKTKLGKTLFASCKNNFKMSIFEFPYYMRIRSNYRDFAFIEGVTTLETSNYFTTYYSFIINFCLALENLKLDLLNMRLKN